MYNCGLERHGSRPRILIFIQFFYITLNNLCNLTENLGIVYNNIQHHRRNFRS